MKLVALLFAVAACFIAMPGADCGDCDVMPNHTLNGKVQVTASPTTTPGDCHLNPTCKQKEPCNLTGNIRIKNISGQPIRIVMPDGTTHGPIADGGTIDISFDVPPTMQTDWPCGTDYTIEIVDNGGASIAEIEWQCFACPVSTTE